MNLEPKTRDICEELTERPLPDDDWTRMKLPTSLGGMGIRAVTSQLEVSFDVTERKTSAQAVRHEKSVEGKREFPEGRREHDGNELWDWAHSIGHDDRVEAVSGPFKWDLVKVSMGHQFFTLRQPHPGIARGHNTQKLWTRLNTTGNAAFLVNCGHGVGASRAQSALEQGMPDGEGKTAVRRRLQLRVEEGPTCVCGMVKDEKGTTPCSVRRTVGGHGYMTGRETARRDKFGKWEQQ